MARPDAPRFPRYYPPTDRNAGTVLLSDGTGRKVDNLGGHRGIRVIRNSDQTLGGIVIDLPQNSDGIPIVDMSVLSFEGSGVKRSAVVTLLEAHGVEPVLTPPPGKYDKAKIRRTGSLRFTDPFAEASPKTDDGVSNHHGKLLPKGKQPRRFGFDRDMRAEEKTDEEL